MQQERELIEQAKEGSQQALETVIAQVQD